MAKGEYAEAEEFAKQAQEIDPNEVAAGHPRLEGQRPSGTTRPTSRTRRPRKKRPSTAFQEVDTRRHRRPRGPDQRDQVRQELQGPDPRAARG